MSFRWFFFGTITLLLPVSAIAEPFYDATFKINYNDNISRGWLSEDRYSDTALSGRFNAGYFASFDDGLSLTSNLALEHENFSDFTGFTHTDLQLETKLKKKLGLGAMVPSIGASVAFTQQDYRTDTRDQQQVDVTLFWFKRLSLTWDLRVLAGYFTSDADKRIAAGPSGSDTVPGPGTGLCGDVSQPGDVFDQSASYVGVEAGRAIGEQQFLLLSYQYRTGDIASSAVPNDRIVCAATAITPDPAINDETFAYKLDADTHSFGVDWSYPINDTQSLAVRYLRHDTEDSSGINYSVSVISAHWVILF